MFFYFKLLVGATRTLPRDGGAEELHGGPTVRPSPNFAPTSRRLIVVVQSLLFFHVVGRNGERTFSRSPTIRSSPIVWRRYR